MGSGLDKVKAQQQANNDKAKEMLDTIDKMMAMKIVAVSSKLQKEASEDKTLPIVAVVDRSQNYRIKIVQVPSKDVSAGISHILSGNFLDGLKNLLSVALNQFLGNTDVGETEKTGCHVVFANNSLLRIDYMIYKYQFSSEGLLSEFQNAFCYYMQVGVLDLEKVNSQIVLYELTRAIGGAENLSRASQELEGLATFAKSLYAAIRELKSAATTSGGASGDSIGILMAYDSRKYGAIVPGVGGAVAAGGEVSVGDAEADAGPLGVGVQDPAARVKIQVGNKKKLKYGFALKNGDVGVAAGQGRVWDTEVHAGPLAVGAVGVQAGPDIVSEIAVGNKGLKIDTELKLASANADIGGVEVGVGVGLKGALRADKGGVGAIVPGVGGVVVKKGGLELGVGPFNFKIGL